MYSVLIISKKTKESFLKHAPIFIKRIQEGKIGVCEWNESGDTVGTALPTLMELIDGKDEWNAVIVRNEDDCRHGEYKTKKNNPYDFVSSEAESHGEYDLERDPVPLIRLTHILGKITDSSRALSEEYEVNRNVGHIRLVMNSDEKIKKIIDDKNEYYRFDGKRPNRIFLISVREVSEDSNTIEKCRSFRQAGDSRFCERNYYPSNCRFVVYDKKKEGVSRSHKDDFILWTTVFLFLTNDMSPSVLQAYKLYNTRTVIDLEKLRDAICDCAFNVYDAKKSINTQIKMKNEQSLDEEKIDYKCKIDIEEKWREEHHLISMRHFAALPKDQRKEINRWRSVEREALDQLEEHIKVVLRTIDKAVINSHGMFEIKDEDAIMLSKYQKEDLAGDMLKLQSSTIAMQEKLPGKDIIEQENFSQHSKKICKALMNKVRKREACLTFLFLSLFLALTFLPALTADTREGKTDLFCMMILLCVGIAAIVFSGLLVIWIYNRKFKVLVHRLNVKIKIIYGKLWDRGDAYSKYVNVIVNHARANSFLIKSKNLEDNSDENQAACLDSLKATDEMINLIKRWSHAFGLSIDFDEIMQKTLSEKRNLHPMEFRNSVYEFEYCKEEYIMINDCERTIATPYNFAEKIILEKEDLYDDNNDW